MILIDLQKAFDTVDHVILLEKLEALGVSSVDWFQSYLGGRMQIVNVNQVDSPQITFLVVSHRATRQHPWTTFISMLCE